MSDKSSDWSLVHRGSFNSQLAELNSYNENNFEWQKVGEFVKPKTIEDRQACQKLNQSNSLLTDQLNNNANVTLNLLKASYSNLAANITQQKISL